MKKNELGLLNPEIIAEAAIQSELIDSDAIDGLVDMEKEAKNLQILAKVIIADEFEEKTHLQNILWDYSKLVRFKIKLQQLVSVKTS